LTVKINLKRAERKVAPAGDYLANIVASEVRESKSDPESSNLHLELTIDAAAHPELEGLKLYDDRSMKEQSWYRIVELMEAVTGKKLEASNEEGDFEFDEETLIGEQVGVALSVDEDYDPDHPRNRVDAYFAAEEAAEPAKEE